ncbi:unnamed protein product [Penicillium camemberti]|uniref:Str. FM013 n=1 Tax=Penicillium camemberti (strain FM 013) TaxID=1429867 RepID=A0A0G4PNK0_PENC3|nr:unnamed protein product [Penicillium camemberti]
MAYTSFLVPSLKTSQHNLGGVYTNNRYGHSIASFAARKSILPGNEEQPIATVKHPCWESHRRIGDKTNGQHYDARAPSRFSASSASTSPPSH